MLLLFEKLESAIRGRAEGPWRKVAARPESVLVLTLWPGSPSCPMCAMRGSSSESPTSHSDGAEGISRTRLFSVASFLCPINRGDQRGCGI